MKKGTGIWAIYNGIIADFRNDGHTEQQTGGRFGVTKQRISQILQKHYGKTTVPHLLTQARAAQLIGCSSPTLKTLRRCWREGLDMFC